MSLNINMDIFLRDNDLDNNNYKDKNLYGMENNMARDSNAVCHTACVHGGNDKVMYFRVNYKDNHDNVYDHVDRKKDKNDYVYVYDLLFAVQNILTFNLIFTTEKKYNIILLFL